MGGLEERLCLWGLSRPRDLAAALQLFCCCLLN
jgi:hypothetical protein